MESLHLSATATHLSWDNTLAPAIVVAPGDEITMDLLDASGGQLSVGDDAKAIGRLDFDRVNPCTGPVFIDGASPGDELVVTLLEITTARWAWTANIPHFGLLSEDFPDAHLWISTVSADVVTTPIGVAIPARPMIGTIGVASYAKGATPLLVPTAAGGNMDVRQIGVGTTLHLPVGVPGALFSAGDTHAVQGDGEVCGTGAETSSRVRLRFEVTTPARSTTPWYEHSVVDDVDHWTCTTGIGPDLMAASRDATRRAIDLIVAGTKVAPVEAYMLLSLTSDLRISEIVDAPNWVVSLHVPTRFTRS